MKLIDNWQSAWRFWSFRLAVIAAGANLALYFLPILGVSGGWVAVLNTAFGIAIAFARVVKQKNISGE
tara:strand:+ start:2163 stop:2366 length:204 start_codon:yes stop_codon:yes gene_type:complete